MGAPDPASDGGMWNRGFIPKFEKRLAQEVVEQFYVRWEEDQKGVSYCGAADNQFVALTCFHHSGFYRTTSADCPPAASTGVRVFQKPMDSEHRLGVVKEKLAGAQDMDRNLRLIVELEDQWNHDRFRGGILVRWVIIRVDIPFLRASLFICKTLSFLGVEI